MNTRHAQIVLAILDEGSFTAAAKALFITQPTLSQTVKQIESQLGEPIFERGRTPVELTPAGQLYAQAAQRLLQMESQLSEDIAALHKQQTPMLRVGILEYRAGELLPQVLPTFYNTCPDVRLSIHTEPLEQLEHMLCDGGLHMAFYCGRASHPQLSYAPIASDEVVLACSRQTTLARRMPNGTQIRLADAAEEKLIMPLEGTPLHHLLDGLFAASGIRAQPTMRCGDIQFAMQICIQCGMAAFVPILSLMSNPILARQLAYYRLRDAPSPLFFMAHAKNLTLAPEAQTLYTLMSNRYRSLMAFPV